jgi:hypothetical protein
MDGGEPVQYFSPATDDAEALADALAFLQAHASQPGGESPVYLSVGDDRAELTAQLLEVLERVVHALGRGQSVSILTLEEEISLNERQRSSA